MTKWSQALKVLTHQQITQTTKLVLINLLMIVFASVVSILTGSGAGSHSDWSLVIFANVIVWEVIFDIILVILTIFNSKNQAFTNQYRLLPMKDWQLYAAQTLSIFLNWLYMFLINVILLGVSCFTVFLRHRVNWLSKSDLMLTTKQILPVGLMSILTIAIMLIFALLVVHLVSFIGKFITDFVPNQKWIKWLIYLVVTVITIYLVIRLFDFSDWLGWFAGYRRFNVPAVLGILMVNDVLFIVIDFLLFNSNTVLMHNLETNQ